MARTNSRKYGIGGIIMCELKDYDIVDIEAIDDERLKKSESGRIQATRVYIKSDVDEVISTLKAERDEYRKHKIIFFEMLSNYAHWKAKALWRMCSFAVIEKAKRKERQEKLFREIAKKIKEKDK